MRNPKNSKKLTNFIKKRHYFIWYSKNYEGFSEESIVEATLNYGNWEDVQKLIKIIGIKKMARIFRKQTSRKRINYYPEIVNYFRLYFKKYA